MRFTRILLLVVLASAIAGAFASDAGALGFEDNPCPLIDPVDHQLKVCPAAETGKAYSLQVQGKGGCTPDSVTYKITGGALPPGLTMSSSALISGTPTQTGSWKFYISVYDIPAWQGGASWCSDEKVSSWQFSITVTGGLQIVQRQSSLGAGVVNQPFNYQLTATGGGTQTWSVVSGALPPGITINSATGLLSGTPTTAGDYSFKVQVSDGTRKDVQTYTVTIVQSALKITKPALLGEVGRPVSVTLAATGGKGAYSWSLDNETLPAGLTLDSAKGVISGTPTAAGSTPLKVTVTDAIGLTDTVDVNFVVAEQLAIVQGRLARAKVGHTYGVRLSATGGVRPRTWTIIGRGKLPAGMKLNERTGQITGTPKKAGTYRLRVQVTDNLGAHSAALFVLKVHA